MSTSMAYQPQGSGEAAQQPLAATAQTTQYIHQYYQAPGTYNQTAAATTPIVAPGALSYYAFQPSANGQKPSEIVPPPAEPDVTPEIAEKAIRKLVMVELKNAGFEKAEPMTVKQLEYEVQAFLQQLYERAHEYANLANRAGVIAPDLVKSCEEFYIPTSELQTAAKRSKKKKRKVKTSDVALSFLPSESRPPSPELLSSDDEAVPNTAAVPLTLRMLPPHFPSLPPKHTYMKTPVSPPKKAALPSLEKKLKTAGLVQKSLQNLLTATEEGTNNEDAELLGHIVNWETGLHPRKRWKVRKTDL